MKIAVPMDEKKEEAEISAVLGRAAYFALYDSETGELTFIDNPARKEPRGAGVAAARALQDAGVEKVVTSHVGPNAQSALKAGDIEVILEENGTLSSVIEKYSK